MTQPKPIELRRAGWFTAALLLVNAVGDGWSGRPAGLRHQLFLLPITLLFLVVLRKLFFPRQDKGSPTLWTPRRAILLAFFFEACVGLLCLYECRHFAAFGYHLNKLPAILAFVTMLLTLALLATSQAASAVWIFATAIYGYAAALLLAIASFPLNYLRSDMLPVIQWADSNVLHHLDPYVTMHVADRLYDFPYLPGMIVAYLPFAAFGVDLRFGSMVYMIATAALVFWAARVDRRREVAALLALFLLCPFLQYRHELYLQPHWFALVAAFVLAQRKHFAWAALALGASMALYQFSWLLFPFFLLHALRRRGGMEAAKLTLLAVLGAGLLAGPFLVSAARRIESNTVSQWSMRQHALADPINLSYWVTYLVRPDKLLWVQAVLMVVIFVYCFAARRCTTLADTLRWSTFAVTIFVMLNVIVDGYFYLMLLVMMLVYTCVANGWWSEPMLPASVTEFSPQ